MKLSVALTKVNLTRKPIILDEYTTEDGVHVEIEGRYRKTGGKPISEWEHEPIEEVP